MTNPTLADAYRATASRYFDGPVPRAVQRIADARDNMERLHVAAWNYERARDALKAATDSGADVAPLQVAERQALEAVTRARRMVTPRDRDYSGWNRDANGKAILDSDGSRHVSGNPEAHGLRLVGCVVPESSRVYGGDHDGQTGWHTRADGDVYGGSDGIAWGVVAMLPGRKGKSRFVAGKDAGDDCGALTFNLSNVVEVDARSYGYGMGATDMANETDVAGDADHLARNYAEFCRTYDAAWQAGQLASILQAEAVELRAEIRSDLAARSTLRDSMRAAKASLAGPAWDRMCDRVRDSVEQSLESMRELRARVASLKDGNGDPELERGTIVLAG